jgi:hypothetical protein
MILIKFDTLKESRDITKEIRWDVTPKIFLDPGAASGDELVDIIHGYMLYIDLVNDKPALVIMQLKRIMSKTVGYVYDVPEDLMKESMNCSSSECIGGMYPLAKSLEDWLKKEMKLS